MSGIIATASASEVALSAATAKTVLQIVAASNHRVRVLGWGVYFDGISGTAEPVVVQLLRQTNAIGGSPTAVTPAKLDPDASETVQTTAAVSAGGTEPTSGDVLKRLEVHPQSGYEEIYPLNQEVLVKGGGRLGIVCTAPATVNVIPFIKFEE